ncbi:GPI ethanolamine phosphate transferase 1 [Hypsizygus marmoreus]|uniref:GPI ethanolamine phosphate transferase 1 n=1 Tax=Hypsizygus marmoreus TaxID=39966 RepID=A0A369JLB2_HYPMA|nr:GPI ethanolamine phosphate transferase 1 [Hypsizygus marmoreus]
MRPERKDNALQFFDCYFTSPVVNGMQSHNVGYAEAKRLVLIIGDGLRADLLFNVDAFPSIPDAPAIVAPHLRSIVESRGAFGISHTHVPTESRPGHVAIIGGMYEDVSAVTKGWKSNPVNFDSVFNQSSFTFSFGSPDILPMFARGAPPGKVKTWSYNEEDEDFTKDATALDIWVLDQLRTLFHNATTDVNLNSQLRSEKVIFFLHLLGLDTTGHSYRPHSREYMNNIQIVDNIVRQAEILISEFYQDEETSYIFTADHGMSVIGNHGDGDPDNTRTPLIAWGRGVRGPLPDSSPSSHDTFSEPWQLGHLFRRDIEQADVTSLMAALIGINWPVNSVGVLPDVDPTCPGFLSPHLGDETLAQLALVNAKVILEHYNIKHELKKLRTIFYKPFSPLEKGSNSQHHPYRTAAISTIESLIQNKEWYAARQISAELIKTGLAGLHYLQTYERLLIRGIVTAAYVGWAAYASLFIFRPLDYSPGPTRKTWKHIFVDTAAVTTLIGFWILFAIQQSPWTFYLYIAFPCYFWQQFFVQAIPGLWARRETRAVNYLRFLASILMVVCVLQGMVVAYSHRFIWSIGFIVIGVLWPMTWPKDTLSQYWSTAVLWAALCLATSVFPLLSVEKVESLPTILSGGITMLVCDWFAASYVLGTVESEKSVKGRRALTTLFSCQGFLILIMMGITASSVRSLQAKQGLPLVNQVSGWIVLVVASALPFTSRGSHHTPFSKFLVYFLGFGPCFVILSISVEGLFYVTYSAVLAAWVVIESIVRNGSSRPVASGQKKIYDFQPDDLRMALFFLFFVQVGFFGTGNVASISSFYLEPVYRLIPIFSPFFMAALLIFKIVAPYIILSVASALLNDFLHLPPFSLLLVALTLTDGMTITFFFNVRDTGSWLEIGQSITFFCITSLLLLWSTGICAAGEYLLADVIATKHILKVE